MIYVISDLHGYPHQKFLDLLKKAGFSDHDFLYILGDVIDRNGDGGVETLEWLMYQTNVQLIMGNHEAALLGCSFVLDEIKDDFEEKLTEEKFDMLQRYITDGGDITLKALQKLSKETQEDIMDYLLDCPYYETLCINSQEIILVHSGFENFSPSKHIEDYDPTDLLWARPDLNTRYYPKILTILGHTPTFLFGEEYRGKIIKTDTWIDIDVGAGLETEPVLLRLDDMREFRPGE